MATDVLGICCSCPSIAKFTCWKCGKIFCEKHFDKSLYKCAGCTGKYS